MRLGLSRSTAYALGLGVLLGWVAARQVIPVPEVLYLSALTSCGRPHEVAVPMAENVSWAVQSGSRFWDARSRRWVATPPWHAGPGKVRVPQAPDGVRLVVKGFASGQIVGASIKAVQ